LISNYRTIIGFLVPSANDSPDRLSIFLFPISLRLHGICRLSGCPLALSTRWTIGSNFFLRCTERKVVYGPHHESVVLSLAKKPFSSLVRFWCILTETATGGKHGGRENLLETLFPSVYLLYPPPPPFFTVADRLGGISNELPTDQHLKHIPSSRI